MTAKTVPIADVFIDEHRRLCVRPESPDGFPEIFRSGMEVHWSNATHCLYSPTPREWNYSKWFEQILSAVRQEYGVQLVATARTTFANDLGDIAQDAVREERES